MKGVIFDMDGTLFDSEKTWREIWKFLQQAYGYPADESLGEKFCGTAGENTLQIAKEHLPELNAKDFIEKGFAIYKERTFAKQPDEKPGLHECIEELHRQGYQLAVASGARQELIELNVERSGLTDYFHTLLSGHVVGRGKPFPDIFLETAKKMNLKPEECYVVEDGSNGILAAVAAGCTPILVPDLERMKPEILDQCAAVCNSLFEVSEWIQNNNQ